jgi:hypothetical protein
MLEVALKKTGSVQTALFINTARQVIARRMRKASDEAISI